MYGFQLFIASLAALAAGALAMPTDSREPIKFGLSAIANQTVCPVKVRIDYDPERVPSRIKVMECQRDPNLWCAKMHIPKHECCQHRHDDVQMECVEIQDLVQVSYPKRNERQMHRISIGCTCAMLKASSVLEIAPDS